MSSPAPHDGPWHEATLTRIVPRTPRLKSFFLKTSLASHRAGQHVDVRLTAEDGYVAQRSYSVASAPGAGEVELLIERLDDGEVSPFFHDIARTGDTLEVRGPLGGHFVWRPEDGGPLLLVAGGSGIAPLMAMVRAGLAAATTGADILLVHSARSAEELCGYDEFVAAEARGPGFRFVAVTTRGAPPRPTDLGRRLDAASLRGLLDRWGRTPRHVFVCGANGFVEAVANGLLDVGIGAARIRTERYGGV
ncbi:FAD-binding oxidoreductase [Variovorax sp. PAMC 28711]|uniref:FAD-binding oxidoreductase n=1 Tax=Variovorax sp. PAMC 28711 TaxID=1795631 RepID=UPI00078CEA89|nr:FAD-binding oxidoreductase [Variovorax sp. PAMC 28711]AMM23667.1 oxidoreductase [Variovorax sp. PAMC 28711]